MDSIRVRLTRKLAEAIDGVDLSGRGVGDTFQLRAEDARLVIAEGWAVRVEPRGRRPDRGWKIGLAHADFLRGSS
jgi:hypothetical protein